MRFEQKLLISTGVLGLSLFGCALTSLEEQGQCPLPPDRGRVNYFPLQVGQSIHFDFEMGTGGGQSGRTRTIGSLLWEVKDQSDCTDGKVSYGILETFSGTWQVFGYNQLEGWQDVEPASWVKFRSFSLGDSLDVGELTFSPPSIVRAVELPHPSQIEWAYPPSSPDTVVILQDPVLAGRRASFEFRLVKGRGLVLRRYNRWSSPGSGSDYSIMERLDP